MPKLTASHLVKRFKGRTVVDGFSFSLSSGEVVGLLGPNGAGKTTSFYMIVGLVPADDGNVSLDDRDITEMPMHARARLGLSYLAQEPSIFRKLTARENILAILETRPEFSKRDRETECEHLLYDLGISHLRDNVAMSLSGGERRRLEIARALAVSPRFILLDEPFAGVDPISVVEIQRIIKGLSGRNIGVLITDHNVRETLGICDRAYIINAGSVLAEGSPEHILENEDVRSVYLGEHFRM
ncbi:MAG: LPS export ABC transporter ATP-binding protein [Gammaproteobacteria bacterium]|nr:LPS export ABC transporter ATP-binding protein [Gammaproteobacteria bacterium]MBU1656141.1 LPS export ABC transporter ATP-binding protein [Gammaproteobacteria bacterium]MBU1960785.1 LPS export ABC transporter ATP-binding protein [Gammaproteobacteria bacterium]